MVNERFTDIEIEKIVEGDYAVRQVVDDEGLDELSASIRRVGLIMPLLVVSEGDKYIVVAGHRRLRACKLAGLAKVACFVRSASAVETHEASLAENLFRLDLSAVETACAIRDLLENMTMTVGEIATAMHRSENWLVRQLDMLDWPADCLAIIHDGKVSVSAAANLALIEDSTYREFLIKNAVEQGATARTTAAWLQAWRAAAPAETAIQAEPVPKGESASPMIPQAPCIVCGGVQRTDSLAYILVCPSCLGMIRQNR